jgi:hypothetical protein
MPDRFRITYTYSYSARWTGFGIKGFTYAPHCTTDGDRLLKDWSFPFAGKTVQ